MAFEAGDLVPLSPFRSGAILSSAAAKMQRPAAAEQRVRTVPWSLRQAICAFPRRAIFRPLRPEWSRRPGAEQRVRQFRSRAVVLFASAQGQAGAEQRVRHRARVVFEAGVLVPLSLKADIIHPNAGQFVGQMLHRARLTVTLQQVRCGLAEGVGFRTHDTLARMPVFKTGLFNHSSTPPEGSSQ